MITVIVPIYNAEAFILNALTSLKNQTYKDFQAILINDGSTDNTLKTVDEFIKNDRRFEFYQKENGGIASAYEMALKYVKGDRITFLDSDDSLKEDALEKFYQASEVGDFDIIQFGIEYYDETGKKIISLRFDDAECSGKEQILYNYIQKCFHKKDNPSLGIRLFKKELLNNFPYFTGSLGIDEMLTVFALQKSNSIKFIDYCGYNCNMRQNSVSRIKISKEKLLGQLFVIDSINKIVSTSSTRIKSMFSVKKLLYLCAYYEEAKRFIDKKELKSEIKKHYEIYNANRGDCSLFFRQTVKIFLLRYLPFFLKLQSIKGVKR